LYCAALTESWNIEFTKQKLSEFGNAILKDDETKLVAPPVPNVDNIVDVETYLCSLGCSSKILRSSKFHDILEIPKTVREGLQYASDKPFGKPVASAYLQKYISFLEKKDGRKRFVRVTQEDKGGSISLYSDEKSQQIIGSMKLINKVVVATTPLERSFVLKTGKRQWLFQAFDVSAFNNVLSAIINIMKQFPDAKLPELTTIQSPTGAPNTPASPAAASNNNNNNNQLSNAAIILAKQATEQDLPRLQEENQKFNQQLSRLDDQYKTADSEYQQLIRLKNSLSQGNDTMKTSIENEFQNERKEFVKDYEQQNQDLRDVIADLERQMIAKSAVNDSHTLKFGFNLKKDKKKKKKNDDSDSDEERKPEPKKVTVEEKKKADEIQVDLEKRLLQGLTDEEKYQIKFTHKHLHRHEHKHIHHHKHIHIDNENKQSYQNIRYNEDKHTITHIITPTNTQIQIHSLFG